MILWENNKIQHDRFTLEKEIISMDFGVPW